MIKKLPLKRCFPRCTHLTCTKHLKQNASKYIEDGVGIPLKGKQDILNSIYGKYGLTDSPDVDDFNKRLGRLRCLIDSKFRQYFDNRLLPLLDAHVIKPTKIGKMIKIGQAIIL